MSGSTQAFVQFDHIRNGIIVLKNGDLRALLEVFAMNFGLKSVEEQEAIVFSYQNFLNSLDFDLQIVVHSRKMDVTPYLSDLDNRAADQENPLMRTQIEEYTQFVRSFVSEANIMAKRFFVVIPFSLIQGANKTSGFGSALGTMLGRQSQIVHINDEHFKSARTQLLQRLEFIGRSLEQVGLSTRLLETEELLKLFWEIYNPERRDTGDYAPVDMSLVETGEIT